MFEIEQSFSKRAKIKVIGVGGGGCNAVNTMIRSGLEGVEFIAVNTDVQALEASDAPLKLAIGQKKTQGLGAGSKPEVGRDAALEDEAKITEILKEADMVFITAGMGGGTGTGAAPIFAKLAKEAKEEKEKKILTVGVVTKPFFFEGRKRMRYAEQGIKELKESVDSLIVIPNEKLISMYGAGFPVKDAFQKPDEVLLNAVQGIADLITHTGLMNTDFADLKTVMQCKGVALMGLGYGEGKPGEGRTLEAAQQAISSPLLEDISINGATGVIIITTGSANLGLEEVNDAVVSITQAADPDAEIICGTVIDESMENKVKVTVIATGLQEEGVSAFQVKPTVLSATRRDPNISEPLDQVSALVGETESSLGGREKEESVPENPAQRVHFSQSSELARARALAQRLGVTNLNGDDLDTPTYMRQKQDKNNSSKEIF